MNARFKAFTKPAIGGTCAYIRWARDGEPKPIRNSDGNPIIYESELLALRAIVDKLNDFFGGGPMRRDGEIMGHHRQAAEKMFQAGE